MLQAFKSIPIVREVHRADQLPAAARGYGRDGITLGWEDRLRARSRRRSDGGVEFGLALPRGTVLRQGDSFILDPRSLVVSVVERIEEVFVIEPKTRAEWGLFGYHIGNCHQPVMLTDSAIVCPDLPGMEQVLRHHDIPFSRSARAFTPIGLAGDLEGAHRHGVRHGPDLVKQP